MDKMSKKTLLVTGLQRAGTTWLAACLSRHPEIGMLMEDTSRSVNRIMGCTYAGNKLIFRRHVSVSTRSNRLFRLMNKVHRAFTKTNLFPQSDTCLQDYDKIIFIKRDVDSRRSSVRNRTSMATPQINYEVYLAIRSLNKMLQEVDSRKFIALNYEDLQKNREKVLKLVCRFLSLPYDPAMMEGSDWTVIY